MFEEYLDGGIVLDVRNPGEFQSSHIEGAINIPVGQLDQRCEKELPDKDAKINVHCLGGVRAQTAKDILLKHGYKHVSNIGGLDEAMDKHKKYLARANAN